MPGVPAGYHPHGQQGPSCFDKIKMGFFMGMAVGAGAGILLGGFSALQMGLRGRAMLNQIGKTIGGSAGSFGLFMSVAQGIRC